MEPGRNAWVVLSTASTNGVVRLVSRPLPQAIPRVTSKGVMCGAVYKVASEQNMDTGVA